MQKFPDFIPTLSHDLKPLMRNSPQVTPMLFHPRLNGRIPLDSAVESQQFRFHRWPNFYFEIYGYVYFIFSPRHSS